MSPKSKWMLSVTLLAVIGLAGSSLFLQAATPTEDVQIGSQGGFGDDPGGAGPYTRDFMMVSGGGNQEVEPTDSTVVHGQMGQLQLEGQVTLNNVGKKVAQAPGVERGQPNILVNIEGKYQAVGGGGGGGGESPKWTTTYQRGYAPGSLVLIDSNNTDNQVTDPEGDEPLYCTTVDGKGKVQFQLIMENSETDETFDWTITDSNNTTTDGELNKQKGWSDSMANLEPGMYTLAVTKQGASGSDSGSGSGSGSGADSDSEPQTSWNLEFIVFSIDRIVLNGRKKDSPDTRGHHEDRFLFQNGEQVQFRAEITPDNETVRDYMDDKFKWKLQEIAGIPNNKKEPRPDWGDGIHAKGIGHPSTLSSVYYIQFHLQVLPSGNDGFGEKELSVETEGENFSKNTKLCLFFDRFGKKHPNPGQNQTANWYYYWSKEGNPAVCEFSRIEGDGKYARYWPNASPYGKYEPEEGAKGTIYISDKVATKDKVSGWNYKFPEGRHNPREGVVAFKLNPTNAPEFANLTYAHEATHRKLHLLGEMGIGTGPDDDQDQDAVPNGWEKEVPGMDVTKEKSFDSIFTISGGSDEEFYCVLGGVYKYGEFVQPGESVNEDKYHGESPSTANEQHDWAEDGRQWEASSE